MPGLRFAVWLGIMTSLYQSGPVFIQLRGQFLGFHGAAAGTGEHHNIKSGELILGQSKAVEAPGTTSRSRQVSPFA